MRFEVSPAYQFDRFVLDLRRGVLLADGVECPLRSKSFAFLRFLVENAGRLVDRDEIMNAVWPGVFVTDDSIAQCVRDIRRALGDSEQRLLRTMTRRGYLLTAEVTQGSRRPLSADPPTTAASLHPAAFGALALDKPSIAVLPFQNMSGAPSRSILQTV
jgi:DNA-binding winged helix-turn-helix (wHTH) protein